MALVVLLPGGCGESAEGGGAATGAGPAVAQPASPESAAARPAADGGPAPDAAPSSGPDGVLAGVPSASPALPRSVPDPALLAATPPERGPWFVPADGAGLDHVNLSGPPAPDKFYLRDTVGPGLAVLDVDGDGRLDLYFPQGRDGTPQGGDSRNRLYRQTAEGRFSECAAEWGVADEGYGYGALAFDQDNDGDVDLFVTNLGPNRLFRNEGGHFVDATAAHPGLDGRADAWSVGAAAGDVDADGDLDLYVANYTEQDLPALDAAGLCRLMGCKVPCGPQGLRPQADSFHRNEGAPDFTLVRAGRQAGLADVPVSYGFQPSFVDVDADGDLDLYVTNDSMLNFLFVNDGRGNFAETGLVAGVAVGRGGTKEAGMGLAIGHADDDLLPELYVTNFSTQNNSYYDNVSEPGGPPWFEERGVQAGCGRATWFRLGWGCVLADFDADGRLDIFVSNGHIYPQMDGCEPDLITYRQPCQLFLGDGDGDGFVEPAAGLGPAFAAAGPHRGVAALDVDDDGDLDLVLTRLDETPLLAINDARGGGRWLGVSVEVVHAPGATPVLAVGARVSVTAGPRRWTRDVLLGTSFLSTEDPRLHFGFGDIAALDGLSVQAPGRPPVSLPAPALDRYVRVRLTADGGAVYVEDD